jgi:amidase
MGTWITRMDDRAVGIRLAVKDAIDVAGVPTTAGCAAVADRASPATVDASCVAAARAGGAVVVGKANLHELCFGTAGTNPWFGNPINPLAPDLVPGGSSSGSAVAVAVDEADVGFGTDTGGSVRIPAACCGVVGLKTTWGRVPVDGVWPLAPSLDTVGPLGRDVAATALGMRLLDAGFAPADSAARVIGRVRLPGVVVDPAIDAAIDAALAMSEFEVVEVALPGVDAVPGAFAALIITEAWTSDRGLFDRPERIGAQVRRRLEESSRFDTALVPAAIASREAWQDSVRAAFGRVELLALPTLVAEPPPADADGVDNALVTPWNLAGTPAISLPVPASGRRVPPSLQLVGPWNAEDLLCATAAHVESAVLGNSDAL